MRKILTLLATLALAGIGLLAFPTAAQADHAANWSANADSSIDSDTSVTLAGPNTSVETGNLNINVDAGDVIAFDYELHDGAECTAGAPRVFVNVNGTYSNSWDGNANQCVVSFQVPNSGLITHAGIVFDQSGGYVDGSSATVSNLTVDGELVHFLNPPPPPDEEVVPTLTTVAECYPGVQTVGVTNPGENLNPVSVTFNEEAAIELSPGETEHFDLAGDITVTVNDVVHEFPYDAPGCPGNDGNDGNDGAPGKDGKDGQDASSGSSGTSGGDKDSKSTTSDAELPDTGSKSALLAGIGGTAILGGSGLILLRRFGFQN